MPGDLLYRGVLERRRFKRLQWYVILCPACRLDFVESQDYRFSLYLCSYSIKAQDDWSSVSTLLRRFRGTDSFYSTRQSVFFREYRSVFSRG